MFDQQTPQPLSPQSPVPPQVQPPVVEDMFARNDATQVSAASQGVSPMGSAGGLQPVMPAGMPPMSEQELFGGRSFSWGRAVVIIISIVILIAIGIGAWFGFQYMMSQQKTETPAPVTTETPTPTPPSSPTQNPAEPTTPVEPVAVIDGDSDGLSDAEEVQLGTNPERADTDIDGLIDRAEIQVYKTNPLKADTDGDGYTDGDEVINGFDPVLPGSARLIQAPQN